MYTITIPNRQPKVYQILAAAKQYAQTEASELGHEVEVVANGGTVAFVATHVVGRHFNPWERIENPRFVAPHFDGFYPAYTRKRIEATVYRSYDGEAVNPWRVHDGRTGGHLDVASTREACRLTKEMRFGRTL